MFKYLRALWHYVTGMFSKSHGKLMQNEHVMASVYDESIKNNEARRTVVEDAVASLMATVVDRQNAIKELGKQIGELNKVKTGTQVAMQQRIDVLRNSGKNKDDIKSDAKFLEHQAAHMEACKKLADRVSSMDSKEAELKTKQEQINTYKIELQNMRRNTSSLEEEKHEAIADVKIAQSTARVDGILAGIPDNTVDADLKAAREARKQANARSSIIRELRTNDVAAGNNQYLDLADKSAASNELDNLLNWGEEATKTDMEPAKLPEN